MLEQFKRDSDDVGGPTFSSRWDKITYLLAAYKWPIFVVVIAATIVYSSTNAQLPTPPDAVVNFAIAAGIIAIPTFFVWKSVARRAIEKNSVRVVEVGGPHDEHKTHDIPPKTWENRETNIFDAYRPPGSDQWKVWSLDWKDDIEQLEVTGVWMSAANPDDVYRSQKKVESIFTDMLKEIMKAKAWQATVAKKGVDIYDEAHKEHLNLSENGILPDGVGAGDKIEELENEIAGSLDIDGIGELEEEDGGRIDERPEPQPAAGDMNEPGGER